MWDYDAYGVRNDILNRVMGERGRKSKWKQTITNKEGKVMKLKKFAISAITAIALVGMMAVLTGCDPEKIGGGGLMQAYNAANGQYK